MSENKYLKKQEAVDYPGKKLPVVFLIDVSESMNECTGGTLTGETVFKDGKNWNVVEGGDTYSIMDSVKERVQDFHDAMREDRKTSVTCQTAYITFGDTANLIEDFGIVKNKKAPIDKLIANANDTHIVSGIDLALKTIDSQKSLLKEEGNGYFQPWLIILTDGAAHDDTNDIRQIKKELIKRQRADKLIVYTMALSDDAEMFQQIRGYSIYKPIPFDKDKNELKEFFKFLKKSISSISNSKMSDRVKGYTEPDNVDELQ